MAKSSTGQNVGKSKVIKSGPLGGTIKGGGKSSGASKTSVKASAKL